MYSFLDSLETDVMLLLLFDNVGAGAGALLCPLKTIEIGPFSRVARKAITFTLSIIAIKLSQHSPGFCLATAENAIGAVGIDDGDWMLLLFELFCARI